MKTSNLLKQLLFTAVIVGATQAASAATLDAPHITVAGEATLDIVPDEMHWSLNVTTRGPQVGQVATDHDRKVSGVVKFLKDHGIEEKKIQTSRISLSENWVYRERSREREGFIGSTTVNFKSDNLDQYRALWTGLAELTDVSVNGVGFETSQRTHHENVARINAVRSARLKAREMAEALEVEIGKPLVIDEQSSGNSYPRPMMRAEMAMADSAGGGGESALSPGTITIRTQVSVTFELVTD